MRFPAPIRTAHGDGIPRPDLVELAPTVAPDACLDTEQVPPALRRRALAEGNAPLALGVYVVLGLALGLVFTQSQVISWFRIYEMFRFDAFHMYGVIGSAVATAALALVVIKRLDLTTVHGEPIQLTPKAWGQGRVRGARYGLGGVTFGLGWALLGACPGPLFALLGGGVTVMAAALLAALLGTWTYAFVRDHLPH